LISASATQLPGFRWLFRLPERPPGIHHPRARRTLLRCARYARGQAPFARLTFMTLPVSGPTRSLKTADLRNPIAAANQSHSAGILAMNSWLAQTPAPISRGLRQAGGSGRAPETLLVSPLAAAKRADYLFARVRRPLLRKADRSHFDLRLVPNHNPTG
jgi:hypothetical protein